MFKSLLRGDIQLKMDVKEKKHKSKEVTNLKIAKDESLRSRNDAQMINQLFNSVKKSEKAIQDTLKSIEATVEFIKKIDEKSEYSSEKFTERQ